jgi:hypothetical protein
MKDELHEKSVVTVFVHMGTEEQANDFFNIYGGFDQFRTGDPNKHLYRAFELAQGSLSQFFGLGSIASASRAAREGFRQGRTIGDPRQMPGAFLIYQGKVIDSHISAHAGDEPNWGEMAQCASGICELS